MDTLERDSRPAIGIEDVEFDAVAVHQRFDEIDAELEILTQRVIVRDRPQHPVVFVHAHAAVPPIDAQPLGPVERRVVGDRGGADAAGETPRLQ